MRFSINTVLFVSPFTNTNTRLFKQFKKWGFDAVELLIEDTAHVDPTLVKSVSGAWGRCRYTHANS